MGNRRAGWLRFDSNPGAVDPSAPNFDVTESAVRVQAAGLTGAQIIPIQMRMIGKDLASGVVWQDVWRNGCQLALSATNNQVLLVLKGTFRLGAGPPVGAVSVTYAEDDTDLEGNVQYTYDADIDCATSASGGGPTPPEISLVTRCTAAGSIVTLQYATDSTGVTTLLGSFNSAGVYTASAVPPPGLISCSEAPEYTSNFLCDPVTGARVIVITTVPATGVPVNTAYNLNGTAYVGSITALIACEGDEDESDIITMCDNGVTVFLRHIVKRNGVPTGTKFDTTTAGVAYVPVGPATVGACPVAGAVPASRVTTSGVNSSAPAGLQAVAITKTNAVGTVNVTMSDATIYPLTLLGERMDQSSDISEGPLPAYAIAAVGGATWKYHGAK